MLTLLGRRFLLCAVVIGAIGAIGYGSGHAQGLNIQTDVLQRFLLGQQMGLGSSAQGNLSDQTPSGIQIYQPVNPEMTQAAPSSRLEALYSTRSGRLLTQFGYDILGVPTSVSAVQVGGIQDSYVLSEGDEIIVDLRGQENATYRQRVDRSGQIILPKLNPISAAGRTFGDFRNDLERQVSQVYLSSNVFVSVGQIRQISVFVTGEVRAPGMRVLNGLATPLDAILLSGGIAKTGSLRRVALIRGNQTINIDLYGLLMQGTLPNIGGLRSGDRIYVPPLQNTVAVAGYVRRPGIYELPGNQNIIDGAALLQLAGGIEIAGSYRLSKISLEADGSRRLISLTSGGQVSNGEVLYIDSASDVALERITLAGAVRLSGDYPRGSNPSLARLLGNSDFLSADAYASFAVIARRNPRLNVRTLIPLSLVPVLAGDRDVELQNDDFVYIFRRSEIRLLANAAASPQPTNPLPSASGNVTDNPVQTSNASTAGVEGPNAGAIQMPQQASAAGVPINSLLAANGVTPDVISRNPTLSAALTALGPNARVVGIDSSGAAGAAGVGTAAANPAQASQGAGGSLITARPLSLTPMKPELSSVSSIAATLGVPSEMLLRTVRDHVVWVLDEVRDPGPYIVGEGTSLGDMIEIAGGVLSQADLSSVEVTSTQIDPPSGMSRTIRTAYKGEIRDFQRVSLHPFDVIRFRPVFSDRDGGRVTMNGQVRYPGTFDITRGERLSSVLERAGGMTDTAFPYGAVFTRQGAAAAEREGNAREARSISAEIASLATSPNPNDRDKVSFLTSLTQQVQNAPALGRITVTADPVLLRVHPELDIILEPGDSLFIPPRPATVTVTGEVLNSGSFQYRSGMDVRDYITVAGGITQGADDDRIFVVLPDGTARPVIESWLSFNNTNIIPPGSTIVVPRDLRPFDISQFLKDAAQITSQLAVTAASLVVIGH